ncbi:MAG: RES family NAD+ phosphorylase [Bryobacterales bacterium]|nr:RES family NAD+ phosphorylase [Bryobacterales bacterium]
MGGRWNSPGTAVVYMAESVSLAVLENLVHMSREDFPTGYVVVSAVIPEGVRVMGEEELVARYGERSMTELGDAWVKGMESAVLRVRSRVVGEEHNFLLNPAHGEFARIAVEAARPFKFDTRLFGGEARR